MSGRRSASPRQALDVTFLKEGVTFLKEGASPSQDAQLSPRHRKEWPGAPKHGRPIIPCDGEGSPEERLIPIPPLCRTGPAKGITNAPPSPDKGGVWRPTSARVASPQKRFHFPSRWSAHSAVQRPGSSKQARARPSKWETNTLQPRLLDALGMAPTPADAATNADGPRVATRLPFFAPKDLEECDEGCYWRWLVHTLLEDVGALKSTLEETREELQMRAERRREIEDVIGSRDELLDELERMSQALNTLRVDVPSLRQMHRNLQGDLEHLKQREQELQDKQQDLRTAIRRSAEWQKTNGQRAMFIEREAAEGQRQERLLQDQIYTSRQDMQRLEKDNKDLAAKRDELRLEVQALEDARGKLRKVGKTGSKSGKTKTKR